MKIIGALLYTGPTLMSSEFDLSFVNYFMRTDDIFLHGNNFKNQRRKKHVSC